MDRNGTIFTMERIKSELQTNCFKSLSIIKQIISFCVLTLCVCVVGGGGGGGGGEMEVI